MFITTFFKGIAGKNPVEIEAPEPEITKKILCKRTYLQNVVDFTNKFGQSALQMQQEKGLPALAVLAQVALETGWGKKILKVYPPESYPVTPESIKIDSKNLFNIKPGSRWQGKIGYAHVWEIIDNKKIWRDEPFRVYGTYKESFNDYADLIHRLSRYSGAVAVKGDPDKYVDEMAKAGYATDPRYASKIKSIMHKNWEIV